MSRHRLRLWIVAALVIAFTAVSAIVFAEWLATGTGEGNAAAGTAVELRVEPVASIGVDATRLVPGGTGDVEVVLFNDNPYEVEVRDIVQDGPITSDQDGCDATTHEVSYMTQTGSWIVPAAGDLFVRLVDALAMGVDAADACQGAEFAVPLAVIGGSNVGATTTTLTPPDACRTDVMFVVDIADDTPGYFEYLGEAVTALEASWDLGPDATRTGLTVYAEDAYTAIEFSDDVPIGPTITSLGGLGTTCLYCGLLSAGEYVAASDRPDASEAIVLISDGRATAGNTNTTDIASLAESMWNAYAVPTYVVGPLGSDLHILDVIADAGGTVEAAGAGADTSAAMLAAFEERFAAIPLGCGS